MAGIVRSDVYTAHLPREIAHYSYSTVLYSVFSRYNAAIRMDEWVLQASRAIECNRLLVDILPLLRRCRLINDPDDATYVNRFWLAVYFKACDDGITYVDMAR